VLRVDDPLKALQRAGRNYLAQLRASSPKLKVVALTGSMGKTSTKEYAAQLLFFAGQAFASPGSQNSQVGLPLSLLNCPLHLKDKPFVLEMGMNHAKEIEALVAIAPPDVALLTSIALVHAGNFENLESIAQAKCEIFSSPQTAKRLIFQEIPFLEKVLASSNAPASLYSCHDASCSLFGQKAGDRMAVRWQGQSIDLPWPEALPAFHESNVLAAIAIALECGATFEQIAEGMPTLQPPCKRFNQRLIGDILFVDDSYNANAISTKAALRALPLPAPGGRRWAILGDMHELGVFAGPLHVEVGQCALECVDHLICVGPLSATYMAKPWQEAEKQFWLAAQTEDVLPLLRDELRPGDVVLLKASKGWMLGKLVEEMALLLR
jgi:UDP-N-acetylmuramoyl-tripeptide--D-alanyl-D-alanine ligase